MSNKEWFSQARFGMMLHWGLYSVLGGEYKGQQLGGKDDERGELGEWIQTYFRIPIAEYEQLTKAFYPLGFDAEEYVLLAKQAGMNYIVITSKHHEGFAMFQSDVDPYNVVDATSYKRDIIGELAAACKKHDMKLGLYYSQEVDWHEPDGGGYNKGFKKSLLQRSAWSNDWDFPDKEKKDYSRCFEKKIKPQVKEILTKYGDIALIWFDTPGVITPEQSQELYDLVKSLQPDCLVNSRIGNDKGDYTSMGDNQVPGGKKNRGMLYETAGTLNDTWGYKSYDHNWKSVGDVISLLTRLASRNVNYLLNIGPDHIGRIPSAAQNILKGVGEWMKVNGEAIYGTEPSPYNVELPSGPVTEKGDSLYFVLNQPQDKLQIPGVLNQVESAFLLGVGEVAFTQENGMVTVQLPELTDMLYPVVRLTAKGGVKVDEGIIEMPDRTFTLATLTAEIKGDVAVGRACDMEKWVDETASLSWTVNAVEAGDYAVQMSVNGLYGSEPQTPVVALSANGETITKKLTPAGDLDALLNRYHKGMIADVGTVRLNQGENTITLKLAEKVERDMFRFASMKLTRQ